MQPLPRLNLFVNVENGCSIVKIKQEKEVKTAKKLATQLVCDTRRLISAVKTSVRSLPEEASVANQGGRCCTQNLQMHL